MLLHILCKEPKHFFYVVEILFFIWKNKINVKYFCYLIRYIFALFKTAADSGGILTIWWGAAECNGSHTLAGRLEFNKLSSVTSCTVLPSFVDIVPRSLLIDMSALINSNSGANLGAYLNDYLFSLL